MLQHNPIGIYDSGTGGLAVYREMRRALPGERFVYLADSDYCPYGDLTEGQIRDRARSAARHLTSAHNCKMVVIACNTVDAVARGIVEDECRSIAATTTTTTVTGMIAPTIIAAALTARMRVPDARRTKMLVLSTIPTALRGDYVIGLATLLPGVEILTRPAARLAPLIENNAPREQLRECLKTYLGSTAGVTEVILGCTHYSPLKPLVEELIPGASIINSAEAGAMSAVLTLTGALSRADAATLTPVDPSPAEDARRRDRFLVTGSVASFTRAAAQFCGGEELPSLPIGITL